jgi:hypothetical protein
VEAEAEVTNGDEGPLLDASTAANIISAVALVVAILAWRTARREAETAARAEETAQRSLYVAYRPYVSIDLYPIEGTGPTILNFASVFHNHGNVPATITEAWSRVSGRGDMIAAGPQLQPNSNPSQLCIFPGREGELTWGASRTSPAWPDGGFLYILVEITYRGEFEERKYTTRVEAIHPVPNANVIKRGNQPMDVRQAAAT